MSDVNQESMEPMFPPVTTVRQESMEPWRAKETSRKLVQAVPQGDTTLPQVKPRAC